MKLVTGLLCTLLLITCVQSRGARGGGSRGGSYRSSRSSSSVRTTRGTKYYSRTSYSRSTVLTYMTLFAYSRIGYSRASYYRYNQDSPEYCVYCNATMTNDTCVEKSKTVCMQSSDCYYMTFMNGSDTNATSLLTKGCLYESYGLAGCEEKERLCREAGNSNCSCTACSDPYCNGASRVTVSLFGLVLAGIFGHFIARLA
ncbi:hypothetical protein ACHWQZ_G016380 [Mnemiopsis leidyi]